MIFEKKVNTISFTPTSFFGRPTNTEQEKQLQTNDTLGNEIQGNDTQIPNATQE